MNKKIVSRKGTYKKTKVSISNHVKEVMNGRSITGFQMAIDLGIPNQFIYSYLMKTDYAPNIADALLLSEYLKTPINELFEINK